MAYEKTTTDLEYKAARAALSVLRKKLPRHERARISTRRPGASSRRKLGFIGLLTRLETALQQGP
jgi:hypothetical protein